MFLLQKGRQLTTLDCVAIALVINMNWFFFLEVLDSNVA